jgi:hypothetical protein
VIEDFDFFCEEERKGQQNNFKIEDSSKLMIENMIEESR